MSEEHMDHDLTESTVRHVAKLARLQPDERQVAQFTEDLRSVLEYVETLSELDVEGVEPLAHPIGLVNRLAPDEPVEPMDRADVLELAPDHAAGMIAVPKVLDEGGGGG